MQNLDASMLEDTKKVAFLEDGEKVGSALKCIQRVQIIKLPEIELCKYCLRCILVQCTVRSRSTALRVERVDGLMDSSRKSGEKLDGFPREQGRK